MKNWILTHNYQILDLNRMTEFWLEETNAWKVFGKDDKEIEWTIAEFYNLEDAEHYLHKIFDLLTRN